MAEKRTALVTGGNRGIGYAIAQGLAAHRDIHVLLASRNLEDAKTAAKLIGASVSAVQVDLLSRETRYAQFQSILKNHEVDILVNNAGVLQEGRLLEITDAQLEESLQVNYLANIDLVRTFAPPMVQRGYGRIVNVSSGWGAFDEGLDGPAVYSMTKAALNALTLAASRELPEYVKINACCPGWVRTRMGGPTARRSPEHGAETPIWLATLPDNGPTGGFFRDKQKIAW